MPRKAANSRAGARGASPVVTLPPATDRKTQRKLRQIVDLELAKAQGRPLPAPRPFRFRFHLVPLCWLAAGLAGLAAHGGLLTVVCGLIATAVTVASTRERGSFTRHYNQGMAAWSALWFQIFAWAGSGWWTAAYLAGWLIPACLWWERYRWRGPRPEPKEAVVPETIEDIWARLCAKQKWSAGLGIRVPLDNGAAKWPILCDGIDTHIGMINEKRVAVAAAFRKSIVSCYTEPDTLADDETRGYLTILPRGSLNTAREWNGLGVDSGGFALVGRFPDGLPVRERIFVPGIGGGIKHTIIAGCDGSGKTGVIDMGLCISAASEQIAPVVLDPQEGQALPAWRDVVPYAAGVDECMTYLRGLHAAMFDRSAELAQLTWTQHRCQSRDGTSCLAGKRGCRQRKGFNFYDYEMIKAARAAQGLPPLPIIEITIDEAAVLLAMKGAPALLLDIAKLGRKVGFRLRIALQVPSISEMHKGELRSILNGGNVICFRTGDKVTNGMANIPANPNELPKVWPDGKPTAGLGFAATVDIAPRPTVTMRTDYVPLDDLYDYAEEAQITGPDESVADRLSRTVAAVAGALQTQADTVASMELVKAHVQIVLAGVPMTAGQVISATTDPVSAVGQAIEEMTEAGQITEDDQTGLLSMAEA